MNILAHTGVSFWICLSSVPKPCFLGQRSAAQHEEQARVSVSDVRMQIHVLLRVETTRCPQAS